MVYKKYIKKDGRIYGPYLYHNTKKDGRVTTHYLGKQDAFKKVDGTNKIRLNKKQKDVGVHVRK